MAVQFRDYYEILGIDRDATEDEIRKAFRKLARKYHPDVAEDKSTAEDKFKEINEAYEVLGAPEKRKKYDQLGANWNQPGADVPRDGQFHYETYGAPRGHAGQTDGFHFEGTTGFSDFFEQFFAGEGGRYAGFGTAGNHGADFPIRGRDIEADILVSLDEVLRGSERVLNLARPPAPGSPPSTRTAKVRIPKGVSEGQLVRCAGLGEPGVNGATAGDVLLRVRLERHPNFRVQGADLYQDLILAPWEAVLGATVTVPTLEGSIRLKVPPDTETGTTLRVSGKGLPDGAEGKVGDLYVVVDIVVPTASTADERALWEQLANLSKFRPRPS